MNWMMLAGIAIIVLLGGMVWIIIRLSKLETRNDDQALGLMQQQVDNLRTQVETSLNNATNQLTRQLGSINQALNERLKETSHTIMETHKNIGLRLDKVSHGLGEMGEVAKRVLEVGKDISSLQDILKAPKLRGGLGELLLSDLLSQILPKNHYTLQHTFKTGNKVDAVIHLGDGLVAVDSKFPLESFKKLLKSSDEEERKNCRKLFLTDLKRHIDDIASKYILEDEGTFDFALMYIPAENVYYETIIRDESSDLHSYSLERHVIPVSPNSFYAYLMTILLGLRGMSIEESAKEIIAGLGRLNHDFQKFQSEFGILGGHLSNARNKYEEVEKRLSRFADRLLSIEKPKAIKAPGG